MKIVSLIVLFVVIVSYSAVLNAQSATGRISGIVVDSETGNPVIGANVIIEGTMRGAAADIEGKYTILNVEPGTHTVIISAISFGKLFVTGVVVR
jgi:hypothetical protein